MTSRTNLRLVSFDGGGVRGLSQLEIMSNIMHRLNWGRDPNDSEAILPYQHFDLIGGSGTGGLIAIMLAKLRMSADEAIEEFCTIIDNVFVPVNITPKERLEALRTCLVDMMKMRGLPVDMKLVGGIQDDSCACFVVTSLQNNVSSKVRLRSYPVRSHRILPITAIEAALASCATMSLFDPVAVGVGHKRKEYIAAGLGATNPIHEVITEAHSLFGGESTVACLLSVGTGHPGIITLTPENRNIDLNRAMQDMMNDCTQKARELEDQIGQSGIYFRFSVEQGMQSHIPNAMDTAWIVTQTETYLEEQNKRLEALAKAIDGLPGDISLSQLESGDVIIGANKTSMDGNTGQLDQIGKIYQENFVARLKPSDVESSCPIEECMEGTREDILRTVIDWVTDSGAANIFWLKGHPGVGKSAIAASLVEKLRGIARLGSGFFFQREKSNSMTTATLWRTVAYDLARRYPALRMCLMEALEADETLPTTSNIDKLFRDLIYKPLVACEEADGQNAPVVIIDALDECGGLDGQHSNQRNSLMRTLKSWSTLPKAFKLIVTSRAEPDIVHLFSTIQYESFEILSGSSVHSKSSEDIERFLEYHLGQIADRSHGSLASDWPGRQIIKWLTRLAAGLFIWVETSLRFIRRGEPQEQLDRILGGASMGGLSALYSSILEASFVEPSEKVQESFHRIVGAIILAKEPLTASSLVHLCSVDYPTLSYIRNGLQSVMDTGETLRFSHQSFIDFLIDSMQCRSGFLINLQWQNRCISLGCFWVMKQHLKFNICDINSSYKRNNEIVGLEQQVKERIPLHLAYASCYWANHLTVAFDSEIFEHIEYFIQNQFLFWLEVLSLTKRVNLGTSMIGRLIEWIQNGNQDDTLARDMKKFIAAFGSIISQSVPHIYLSALPLSPRLAGLPKQYMKDYPRTIGIERGGQGNWPAIQNVIVGHKRAVRYASFSPDGTRIVSDSWDNTVRVWDAETAEMVAGPFEGSKYGEILTEFSPDGRRIVSVSYDKTTQVYDTETGEITVGPFAAGIGITDPVALSPDGTRLVSASDAGMIQVFDIETGKLVVESFERHTKQVSCVAFSPDGVHIASGSYDMTIRVWDAKTAEMVVGPFKGHTNQVSCVAFSPDGLHIASGSYDMTIRVWGAETAEMVAGPFEGHTNRIRFVAFSSDGTRIISRSDDWTIQACDAKTGETVTRTLKRREAPVHTAAFSPDGRRIVSAYSDMTIRMFDTETAKMIAGPFEGHTGEVNSLAFSPDGTRIVSGSDDMTVRVWDADNTEIIIEKFGRQEELVHSVAFSCDGTHTDSDFYNEQPILAWDPDTAAIARSKIYPGAVSSVASSPDGGHMISGSYDEPIRVWGLENAEMTKVPFEEHPDLVDSVLASSPSEAHAVPPSDDEPIQAWDAEYSMLMIESSVVYTSGVHCVAFSPDGRRIVSGYYDSKIRVWDAETAEIVAGPFEGHRFGVSSVAFSPDGTRIVSGSVDKTIRVWDAKTAEMIVGPFEGHTQEVSSVAFSPDGTQIVSGSVSGTFWVWDAETGEMIAGPFAGHNYGVASVAFSPDGIRIASGYYNRKARLWDPEAADMIAASYEGHKFWVTSVQFLPGGVHIFSGSRDRKIRVWEAEAVEMVAGPFEQPPETISSVAFSPDGARIISCFGDGTFWVWDVETVEIVAGPFEGHTQEVKSVAFLPDGSRIVSGSRDNTLRVWDAETTEMIAGPFEGHTSWINSVEFSPDGMRIISASNDETIRVWDAKNADSVSRLIEGHAKEVGPVAFSPNEPRIASGSEDTSNHLWCKKAPSSTLPSFTDSSLLQDGWILGPNSELLFWVPPVIRTGLFRPSTILIIGECLETKLNLEHFVHGEAWIRCRDPLPSTDIHRQGPMVQVSNVVRSAKRSFDEGVQNLDASVNEKDFKES